MVLQVMVTCFGLGFGFYCCIYTTPISKMIVSVVSIGLAAAGYHKGTSFRRVSDAKVHFQLHVFHLRLEVSHWLFGLFSIWSADSSQHSHQERVCWFLQPRLADRYCQCLCGGAHHGLIPGEPAFLDHICYSVSYFVTFVSVITPEPHDNSRRQQI